MMAALPKRLFLARRKLRDSAIAGTDVGGFWLTLEIYPVVCVPNCPDWQVPNAH